MRKSRKTAADNILIAYRYSAALQRVGCSLEFVREDIRSDSRKVIPAAALARKFDVSSRMLWKWIADGWLGRVRSEDKPGEMRKRRGVPRRVALQFLKHLERPASVFQNPNFFGERFDYSDDWPTQSRVVSRAGRKKTAQAKIWVARRKGLDGQGMNPRQYAEALGVSRSAVWRAIASRDLASWKPTPHRTIIGKRPRTMEKKQEKSKEALDTKNTLNSANLVQDACRGAARPLHVRNACGVIA